MRGCDIAVGEEVFVYHPHQLRHNAATRLRREYGLEAPQVILGHKMLSVTEVTARGAGSRQGGPTPEFGPLHPQARTAME